MVGYKLIAFVIKIYFYADNIYFYTVLLLNSGWEEGCFGENAYKL